MREFSSSPYHQYLPSKKFFIIILSFTVIFGGVFGYQAWKKRSNLALKKESIGKIIAYAASNANIDTDGDELLDWEESALGTNYKKADTDGDGTSDGEEIANRRDPLTPGPNDYVSAISTTTTPTISSAKDLTETEKMMRTILAVAIKDNGKDQNFPQTLAKGIVDTINQKSSDLPTTYLTKDIKIITETEASLKDYGNMLGEIFKKYDSQATEEQKLSIIILTSLKTKNNSAFQSLPLLKKARKEQISEIIKLSVPKEMVFFHVSLLNSLSNILISMDNMGYTITDPARGLIGMKQYKNEVNNFNGSLSAIIKHFNNSGIIFTSKDTGFPLNDFTSNQ